MNLGTRGDTIKLIAYVLSVLITLYDVSVNPFSWKIFITCCEILDCKLISIGGLIMGILCAWVKVVSLQNSFILKDLPDAARVSVAQVNIFDNCSAWGFLDHVGSVNADPRPSWAIACGYK